MCTFVRVSDLIVGLGYRHHFFPGFAFCGKSVTRCVHGPFFFPVGVRAFCMVHSFVLSSQRPIGIGQLQIGYIEYDVILHPRNDFVCRLCLASRMLAAGVSAITHCRIVNKKSFRVWVGGAVSWGFGWCVWLAV